MYHKNSANKYIADLFSDSLKRKDSPTMSGRQKDLFNHDLKKQPPKTSWPQTKTTQTPFIILAAGTISNTVVLQYSSPTQISSNTLIGSIKLIRKMPPAKAPVKAPSYRLEKNNKDAEGFEEWDAQKLAEYFKKAGVGEYGEMFITHKITGRLAPLLTDLDLKEMGKSNHFLKISLVSMGTNLTVPSDWLVQVLALSAIVFE
jgi:hypothetical protein